MNESEIKKGNTYEEIATELIRLFEDLKLEVLNLQIKAGKIKDPTERASMIHLSAIFKKQLENIGEKVEEFLQEVKLGDTKKLKIMFQQFKSTNNWIIECCSYMLGTASRIERTEPENANHLKYLAKKINKIVASEKKLKDKADAIKSEN